MGRMILRTHIEKAPKDTDLEVNESPLPDGPQELQIGPEEVRLVPGGGLKGRSQHP